MDLDSGVRVPVPTWLNGNYAFDHAVGRRGWVAAQVDRQVAAFADGSVIDPVRLPDAWQMFPAATEDLLLLRRRGLGRESALLAEKYSMAVVGADGRVHRAAVLPWGVADGAYVVGEVGAGVVTWAGIGGWDGTVSELPAAMTGDRLTDPRPFAVLAGQVILFEGVDYVEAVDTLTGGRCRVRIPTAERGGPFGSRFPHGVTYSDDTAWLHAVDHSGPVLDPPGSIVASLEGHLRWLPRQPGAGCRSNVIWSGNRLLIGDFGPAPYQTASDTVRTAEAVFYDPAADAFTAAHINVDGREDRLRLDVTARFAWPA